MSNLFSRSSLRANIVTVAMAAFLLVACGGDSNKGGDPDPSAEADFVVDLVTPCKTETEDNCEYGELLDTRDGLTYKTVKIGDQVWMAENLNYKVDSSWCGGGLDNTEGDCSKYGRLYAWAAAIDSAKLYKDRALDCGYDKTCSLPDTVYGICPSGWHLPDTTEWSKLFTAVGGISTAGKKLKSQSGWKDDYDGTSGNGTDAYGFSAFPVGYRDYDGYFYREGNDAYFCSATEYASYLAFAYGVHLSYSDEFATLGNGNKDDAISVRCLKDDP